MSKYLFLLIFLFGACLSKKNSVLVSRQELSGNWIILGSRHILKSDAQRNMYAKAQDSILNLFGLKLISFNGNGEFLQIDSLFGDRGIWTLKDSGTLNIHSAGRGFENFKGTVVGVIHDTILIDEMVHLGSEKIKLIWHFKKIASGGDAAKLFRIDNNKWRERPSKNQTDEELKAKVIAMLNYYSLYYKLVARESIYFSSSRIPLPFNYYQHGVGLRTFEPNDQFSGFFFDARDASKAYELIKQAFRKIQDEDFPSAENFVAEYARYFDMLATEIG